MYRVQQLVIQLAYLAVVPAYRRQKVAHRLVEVSRCSPELHCWSCWDYLWSTDYR